MDFYIENKIIRLKANTLPSDGIIGDNADYITNFTFDAEWDGKTKTARFRHENRRYVDVILTDDSCKIPIEVLKEGTVAVGVYAAGIKSTNTACFTVFPSVLEKGGVPADPTPDVYNQILAKLNSLQAGAVDQEAIETAVEEYLKENPISDSNSIQDVKVDGTGNLIITLTDGNEINCGNVVGPQGETGAIGPQGPAGQDGATPNLTIGTVETLPAGQAATATITGTDADPVLNLGIPQGLDGATGSGDEWETIAEGTLAEGAAMIEINQDLSGNSFQLRKVVFSVIVKQNSGLTSQVGGNFAVNGVTQYPTLSQVITNFADCYPMFYYDSTTNIKILCAGSQKASVQGISDNQLASSGKFHPPISKVGLNFSGGNIAPAGSTYRLLGVKA